jgi:hypothetical protein
MFVLLVAGFIAKLNAKSSAIFYPAGVAYRVQFNLLFPATRAAIRVLMLRKRAASSWHKDFST